MSYLIQIMLELKEIERSIILPIQNELNQYSKLTFSYDLIYDRQFKSW